MENIEKNENGQLEIQTESNEHEYLQESQKKASFEMLTRKKMILLLGGVVLVSSLFGAIFGFMAGGATNGLLGKIGFQKGLGSASKNQPADVEKIISEDSAVISTVEKTSPAVVSIIISKNVPTMRNFNSPFDLFPQFFGQSPAQGSNGGTQKQEIGGGSGFFVTSDGMIVTNKHVVSDNNADYTVINNDGKEYPAKVLARDPVTDIALIKIEGKDFPVLNLGNSDELKIGQTVIAIGNSLGEFSNTVSRGIISGLKRNVTAGSELGGMTENLSNIVQTDAAINPGNSGGPLIDIQGDVIGVNVAMAQGAQNIGFALPINQVKKIIEQVKQTGKISAPFLGIRYLPIDSTIQKDNNLPFAYGVIVQRGQNAAQFAVMPGSPADKAGIVENDIVLEVDGTKIDDKNQLSDLIAKNNVGDKITLKIWHKGEYKNVDVVLQERK